MVSGISTIKGGGRGNLKTIVGRVGKEFGAADKMQWIIRVLREHGFAVRKIAIMAYPNIFIGRLWMSAELHTGATRGQRIERNRRGCRSDVDRRVIAGS